MNETQFSASISSDMKGFSRIIKASRFPLICLVLVSHSLGFDFSEVKLELSGQNAYIFITQLLSHNYAKIAVCCFFFFSGLLFFRDASSFSGKWMLDKWKNRLHTILIPFVCWNLIMIVSIAVKNIIFGLFGHYSSEEMAIVSFSHVPDWFRNPADFPLWFMEDLLAMSFMAPLLYLVMKRWRMLSLILLLVIYASPWNPGHVSMRAIFFFSLGAWTSINCFDLLRFCRRFRVPGHILAAITLLFATFMNSSPCHEWTLRLFYPFGIISFLNIIDAVITRSENVAHRLETLSGSVFFIYAAHEIYVLGWTKGLCLRLFGGSLPAMYLRYFLVPVIVIAVCYTLYMMFHKYTPRVLAFLCGGR